MTERPGLVKLKEILRADDTLVVWRLDRLGRSLKDLIAWVAWLEQEGIGLRSLHEALDTTTPSGKLTFHIFGALAEFERQLIQERTQAGLRVARARGRLGGRPQALPADKRQLAVQLYQERKVAVKHICELMGISKPTSMPMCGRRNRPYRSSATLRCESVPFRDAIYSCAPAGHFLCVPWHPGVAAWFALQGVHFTENAS